MNTDSGNTGEHYDLDDVELGFVVSFRTLRELLATLSADGRRWWLATDPSMAVENGYVTLAYGYLRCNDPLNTIYFRLPVLSKSIPSTGTDRVTILFDAFHFFLDQPRSFRSLRLRFRVIGRLSLCLRHGQEPLNQKAGNWGMILDAQRQVLIGWQCCRTLLTGWGIAMRSKYDGFDMCFSGIRNSNDRHYLAGILKSQRHIEGVTL